VPDDLARHFLLDRFAAGAGARLVEIRPGYARARMRVGPGHANALGVAMGGAVFTLADLAFAACCNSRGRVAVAVQVSIAFTRPGRGLLTAVAREVSRSSRLSSCDVRVTDARGELVATFQGLAYVKDAPQPLPGVRTRSRRSPARRRGASRPR
jgi:acyl-CoA thioesterase